MTEHTHVHNSPTCPAFKEKVRDQKEGQSSKSENKNKKGKMGREESNKVSAHGTKIHLLY